MGANFAEGYGHQGDKELARFLGIAISSSSEPSYHLLVAKDLRYLNEGRNSLLDDELDQVQRMPVSLRLKVSSSE